MKLEIIIASTRPGRIGDQVGAWIADYATKYSAFEVTVADIQDFNLPLFDEPGHPMAGVYEKEHTKAWSKRIGAANAFVVVTPEYNYTMPPSLGNAIDFLHHEWKYKPVAFVGYGGTGAVRAIQTEKLLFANLAAMPLPHAVNFMRTYAGAPSPFKADEAHVKAADKMLDELSKWTQALSPLQAKS